MHAYCERHRVPCNPDRSCTWCVRECEQAEREAREAGEGWCSDCGLWVDGAPGSCPECGAPVNLV